MSLDAAAAVADAIDRAGRTARLRRLTPQPAVWFDVTLKAVPEGWTPEQLVADVDQGLRTVRVSNREIAARKWQGPPRRGDQLFFGDRAFAVQGVDTRTIGDDVAMHIMQVTGG